MSSEIFEGATSTIAGTSHAPYFLGIFSASCKKVLTILQLAEK